MCRHVEGIMLLLRKHGKQKDLKDDSNMLLHSGSKMVVEGYPAHDSK